MNMNMVSLGDMISIYHECQHRHKEMNEIALRMFQSVLTKRAKTWFYVLRKDLATMFQKDVEDIILLEYSGDYAIDEDDDDALVYKVQSHLTLQITLQKDENKIWTGFEYCDGINRAMVDIVSLKGNIEVLVTEFYYITQKEITELSLLS